MLTDRAVRQHLVRAWGLPRVRITAHHGGMNSATWIVQHGEARWVAKNVTATNHRSFLSGLAVAAHLQRAGIPAGAPVPTTDGRPALSTQDGPLALLTWVDGDELSGDSPAGQRLIGATLARVHRALATVDIAEAHRFHWVDPLAAHLAVRPWVRPAVTAAVAALRDLDVESLSWGLLHADPSPDAFRHHGPTGVCGVIDWGSALAGPMLYDLASAVMYVGGPPRATHLIEAYLHHGTVTEAEIRRGLATMLQFRWAVQADYFARRITANDLTGIAGPDENDKGLRDAERHLIPTPARH